MKRLASCGGSKDKGIPTEDQDNYWSVPCTAQSLHGEEVDRLACMGVKIKRYAPEIRMVRPTTQYMTG